MMDIMNLGERRKPLSVIPVKTGIQVLLGGPWMPAYDCGHDESGPLGVAGIPNFI